MSGKHPWISGLCCLLAMCLTACAAVPPVQSSLQTTTGTQSSAQTTVSTAPATEGTTIPTVGSTGSTAPTVGTTLTTQATQPTQGSTAPASTELQGKLTYTYAGNECAAFCWEDPDPAACRAGYRLSGTQAYTYIDSPLIRKIENGQVRADILGLQGGKQYDFCLQGSDGAVMTAENVTISAFDRSGYAHFGYTDGVGAYLDNGQLKPGALVIYLTEGNKNQILESAYVDGKPVDIRPYMKGNTGIGELLNNRRYSGTDRFDIGIAKLCQVYGAVTIRILGTVQAEQRADGTSTILGLTDYNAKSNGGSQGDNGRMARMVNAKNLTIEGVGQNAVVDGWGFHFICDNSGNAHPGAGESFEVRNIRFQNYPEDAVGMEGQQEGSTLTSPVQRCWIHHNTFYPGYCAKPAESDKAHGDGSCDFKRGRYYTLSYNYFVDCRKTNLVGAGDSVLQYDITFHHNFWDNCGSRMPLLRNANLHFYNNYIRMEQDRDVGVTGTELSFSYVTSARANCLMFAENNYYEGCKRVVELKGGAVKAWGNVYEGCTEEDGSVKVASRTETIPNHCGYRALGIDYSAFDTDPTLFYYDAARQESSCYLTDAVTARREVSALAGTQNRPPVQLKPPAGEPDTPDAPTVPPVEPVQDGVAVIFTQLDPSLAEAAGFHVENGNYKIGVSFTYAGVTYEKPLKLESRTVITFALAESMTLTLKVDKGDVDVKLDGTRYEADGSGYVTVTLAAGTHTITKGDSCNLCYVLLKKKE